jgi:hypothetical protein
MVAPGMRVTIRGHQEDPDARWTVTNVTIH